MGIIATYNSSAINKHLNSKIALLEQNIVKGLSFIGDRCINEARTNKTYQDQTGNLTASIGFLVSKDGVAIQKKGFKGGAGATGGEEGLGLANKLIGGTNGYCLVVVAGMNYAFYVEARGFNVLSSAETLANKLVPKMLKSLKLS